MPKNHVFFFFTIFLGARLCAISIIKKMGEKKSLGLVHFEGRVTSMPISTCRQLTMITNGIEFQELHLFR